MRSRTHKCCRNSATVTRTTTLFSCTIRGSRTSTPADSSESSPVRQALQNPVDYCSASTERCLATVSFFSFSRAPGQWCPAPDLLHERKKVAYTPVVCDLAVLDAHHIDGFKGDLAEGG